MLPSVYYNIINTIRSFGFNNFSVDRLQDTIKLDNGRIDICIIKGIKWGVIDWLKLCIKAEIRGNEYYWGLPMPLGGNQLKSFLAAIFSKLHLKDS